jgi:AraC-like DNA-binding protein
MQLEIVLAKGSEPRARSVTEVGLMLGFADTSSFTTSFRRSVGISPSDYRRSVA